MSAISEALELLSRVVEILNRELSKNEPTNEIENVTEYMRTEIDIALGILKSNLAIIKSMDEWFKFEKEIHAITYIIEAITTENKQIPPYNREEIINLMKNMYAEICMLGEINTTSKNNELITSLKNGISGLFRSITRKGITLPETDRTMTDNMTPFMKILYGNYSRQREPLTIYTENRKEFTKLYTENNKGTNKSIETKKVYIYIFKKIIDIPSMSDERTHKILYEFIKPLFDAWINSILMDLFKEADAAGEYRAKIDVLSSKIRELFTVNKNKLSLEIFNNIRSTMSHEYQTLKTQIVEKGIPMEQFETAFIASFKEDIPLGRILMRDSMKLEAI